MLMTALCVAFMAVLAPVHAYADGISDTASDAAITWLAGQPVSGLSFEERADLALAYQIGGAPAQQISPLIDDIKFELEQSAKVTSRELAKAIVVLDIAGEPLVLPGSNRDLVSELRASTGKPPDALGEYRADFGNELSTQAWGIIAESRVGGRPDAETGFLLSQQCPEGVFVVSPTAQACGLPANPQDQALALTALLAASRAGVSIGDAAQRLMPWIQQQWHAGESVTWPGVAASSLSWLVWPLGAMSRPELATSAQAQVRSLQLLSGVAPDVSQVGAIGGENATLVQDLLQRRLYPSPPLTVAAIHALRPTDLTTYQYSPRAALGSLPRPGPSAVGPSAANPGQSVSFLAQGFAPSEAVSLTIQGIRGTVAKTTTDKHGSATIAFTTKGLNSTGQELLFTGASGQTTTRHMDVVKPLAGDAGSSGDQAQAQSRPFEVSLPQAFAGAAVLLLALLVGARLLRQKS